VAGVHISLFHPTRSRQPVGITARPGHPPLFRQRSETDTQVRQQVTLGSKLGEAIRAPGLIGEAVPGMAAERDDVVVVAEDAVRQPVVAHELPNILHDIELGAFRRQRQQGDVLRYRDVAGEVPTGLIEQEHRVLAGAHHDADLGQVRVHRGGVAEGQHQGRALALLREDGAKDVGRGVALVLRRGRPGPAPCTAAGDAVLLADAGFVGEPDLYRVEADALLVRDACQRGGEVFLNASMASVAWA
jgi:hypothetical protein